MLIVSGGCGLWPVFVAALPTAQRDIANRGWLASVAQQLIGLNLLNQTGDTRLGFAPYLTMIRLHLAGQDLHERRLARAVAA